MPEKISPAAAKFFFTQEELTNAADIVSRTAESRYQGSAYMYYIARYMVGLHEATIGTIPIQVWNEFRSALDHHMRYLTLPNTSDNSQILKMEGHLQRAVLDVCKLFTHRTLDGIEDYINTDTVDLLRMVDSGRFYETLRTGLDQAKEHFAKVKTCDAVLGNERGTDKQVVTQYLNVAFEVWNLASVYSQARHDIEVAAATRRSIQHEAASKAVAEIHEPWYKKLFADLLGHAVWYSLAIIVGVILSKFL